MLAVDIAYALFFCTVALAAPSNDRLSARNTCAGDASLSPCGSSYPSDFCCPHATLCTPLNVTGAVATVCCPAGSDCSTIRPTTCDQSAYNATLAASNQIHVSPIMAPSSCGTLCCPPGYACQNSSTCTAVLAATSNASSTASTLPSSTATNAAAAETSSSPVESQASTSSFSGTSFAAGFVPGIVLGMLVLAAAFWLIRRRRNKIYNNEKSDSSDQLTQLESTSGMDRSLTHKRSISGPSLASDAHIRTDFLRCTPPSDDDTYNTGSNDTTDEERSSGSDQHNDRRPMYEFAPSPIPSQSPLPAHLKRGTLTYSISPLRQLRTKKSVRSLRRAATSPSNHERKSIARSNTSASTETTGTIKVLMTPDQRPSYIAPQPVAGQGTSPAPSSIYPQPWTPTRSPQNPQQGRLGSPYMYQSRNEVDSTYLNPNIHTRDKRVTTFSTLMEKAGLHKEHFLPSE